jgi:hypothetical protein
MTLAPLLNTPHVIRVSEVIAVSTFGQPSTLAFGFGSPAAIGCSTEDLAFDAAVVRRE